jgi:hypothetical protein
MGERQSLARPAKPDVAFDPVREAARAGIRILDRADGGREFILPATRNFPEKRSFSICWLFVTASLVVFAFLFRTFINAFPFPGIVRFFILNHLLYFWGILALIELVLTIAVADMWLRSSRIIAATGQLQTVTRWLFFKRAATVFARDIIEIRIDSATTVNNTVYYDILVLTIGTNPGWLARNFPAKPKPDSCFTENDLKCFNSGGRKLRVATGIEGKGEAGWFAAELRRLLKLDNAAPSPSIGA